jgi:hypothetical protein
MQKWEYAIGFHDIDTKEVIVNDEEFESVSVMLTLMGDQGWELAGTSTYNVCKNEGTSIASTYTNYEYFYFKRPLEA